MDAERKSAAAEKTGKAASARVERERTQFKTLILGNANYFGTAPESKLPVVKALSKITTFEQLMCVGYNPSTEYLEAVVHIKQNAGYGGGVCTPGSKEYVRFYLSYDNGATWVSQGLSALTVYDTAGPKPLEYSVRVKIDPPVRWCFFENLPLVRAILSWNNPPTGPNFNPVYGNVVDQRIQIRARRFPFLNEFLQEAGVEIKPELADLVDLAQPLEPKPPVDPGPLGLVPLYLKNDVQAHRLLHSQIEMAIAQPEGAQFLQSAAVKGVLDSYKVDLSKLLDAFINTDGNQTFEELNCVGLSQGPVEWLTATFRIKRKFGYQGDLCTNGSFEYVAFWIDYGAGYQYVGTGAVNVHDLDNLPAGGIEYSVSVPVNTLAQRQPCDAGPKTARVRAILSYQSPPPPANPNFIPTWGGREETTVLLQPGPATTGESSKMYVDTVGNMAVCDVDQVSGLASGQGVIAAFTANQSPFGGSVRISGFIINPPNAMAFPALRLKYRVSVRRLTDLGAPITGWQPLANDFDIVITEQNGGGLPVQYHHLQQIDADGFYTYFEQVYVNQWRQVALDKIASWETAGLTPGLWEILVETKLPDGTILPPGTIACTDGTTRSTVRIRLDEAAPDAHIHITGFIHGGGPVNPAADCSVLRVGDTILGTYSTADADLHWGTRSISIEPASAANGASVVISPIASSSAGEHGTWSLVTNGMDACGFILYLHTEDNTIVNSGGIGWPNSDAVGFCLR